MSSRGDWPSPAGTHLILGGVVSGDHVAKIVGVHAVNIPRVEFDGGHAFKVQGNRGGGAMHRWEWPDPRREFFLLRWPRSTRRYSSGPPRDLTPNCCPNLSHCLPDRRTDGILRRETPRVSVCNNGRRRPRDRCRRPSSQQQRLVPSPPSFVRFF